MIGPDMKGRKHRKISEIGLHLPLPLCQVVYSELLLADRFEEAGLFEPRLTPDLKIQCSL